jgi:hypothetical protein
LLEALDGVDELVLLGDAVELREAPLPQVLAVARPVLARIGAAMAGGRVTLVPGNHDHQLAGPLLEGLRADGAALAVDATGAADGHGPLGAVAGALAPAEVRLAYPGLWVRGDLYATHGHYLDVHNTVPSLERLAIGAVQRATGRSANGAMSPDDYEAAVAPVYALGYSLAQSSRRRLRQDRSVKAWQTIGRGGVAGRLLGGVALPAAVGLLNRAGLGPLEPDVSGPALRESALAGMRAVIDRLGIDAAHVVFGHTHRSGPHPGDAGWDGLVNSGSWIHEPHLLGADPSSSPYRPGHVVFVGDAGPPRLVQVLSGTPA